MSNAAIFIVSTGRCGTQWLARFFEQNLGAAATVTHEPLHSAWSPREMLGARSAEKLTDDLRGPIDEHVQWIREVLRKKTYIECGHPLWSSAPFLSDNFKPDVRFIHLVRHPVPTAWSWLTHRAFCKALAPHVAEKILISPFDEGVQFSEYRERWPAMSPFEKALYYWLEVNALAISLRSTGGEWLTLSFDEMFDPAAQRRLLEFAGAPRSTSPNAPGFVDDLRFSSEIAVNPMEIGNHPEVLCLAAELGFDPLDFDLRKLQARYSQPDAM